MRQTKGCCFQRSKRGAAGIGLLLFCLLPTTTIFAKPGGRGNTQTKQLYHPHGVNLPHVEVVFPTKRAHRTVHEMFSLDSPGTLCHEQLVAAPDAKTVQIAVIDAGKALKGARKLTPHKLIKGDPLSKADKRKLNLRSSPRGSKPKEAFLFTVTLNDAHAPQQITVQRALVNNATQLATHQADRLLAHGIEGHSKQLNILQEFSNAFRLQREKHGTNYPNDIPVAKSPAREIAHELSVIANAAFAKLAKQENMPILFSNYIWQNGDMQTPFFSPKSMGHAGLGVAEYAKVANPAGNISALWNNVMLSLFLNAATATSRHNKQISGLTNLGQHVTIIENERRSERNHIRALQRRAERALNEKRTLIDHDHSQLLHLIDSRKMESHAMANILLEVTPQKEHSWQQIKAAVLQSLDETHKPDVGNADWLTTGVLTALQTTIGATRSESNEYGVHTAVLTKRDGEHVLAEEASRHAARLSLIKAIVNTSEVTDQAEPVSNVRRLSDFVTQLGALQGPEYAGATREFSGVRRHGTREAVHVLIDGKKYSTSARGRDFDEAKEAAAAAMLKTLQRLRLKPLSE